VYMSVTVTVSLCMSVSVSVSVSVFFSCVCVCVCVHVYVCACEYIYIYGIHGPVGSTISLTIQENTYTDTDIDIRYPQHHVLNHKGNSSTNRAVNTIYIYMYTRFRT